tara:strand:- start:888 stop:1022 length:135 start_codon:yes stop_codon:yes gene_type:complete
VNFNNVQAIKAIYIPGSEDFLVGQIPLSKKKQDMFAYLGCFDLG